METVDTKSDSPEQSGSFIIGDWLVHPALNRIDGPDKNVQITFKCMQILKLLADAGGDVLSRRELLKTAWSDTVVNEESLTRAICDLRQALGDDPAKPRYVETIRKGGYRLIMPIQPAKIANPTTVDPNNIGDRPVEAILTEQPLTVGGFRIKHRRSTLAAALILGLSSLVFLVFALTSFVSKRQVSENRTEVAALSGVPLTSSLGQNAMASFSPDGNRVAFSRRSDGDDFYSIFVKQPNQTSELRLTDGDHADVMTTWSPDGSTIAFVRQSLGRLTICTIPSLGGAPRAIHENVGQIHGLDWSPDGKTLVYGFRVPDGQYNLYLLELATGDTKILTYCPNGGLGDKWPVFSPDGSQVAFERYTAAGKETACVAEVANGSVRVVSAELGRIGGLDWYPGGQHLIAVGAKYNRESLWQVNINTGAKSRLFVPWSDLAGPAVSHVDSSLILEVVETTRDIVKVVLTDKPDNNFLPAQAQFRSSRTEILPCYSPVTSEVAFCSTRTGSQQIFVVNRDGSNLREVSSFENLVLESLSWSPDGSTLLFLAIPEKGNQFLGVLDPYKSTWKPIDAGGKELTQAIWSADGQAVFYHMFDDNSWALYKLSLETVSTPVKLFDGIHYVSHECPVSGDLYFYKIGQPGLFKFIADTGVEKVVEFPDSPDVIAYTNVGSIVYCLLLAEQGSTVVRFDTQANQIITLGQIDLFYQGRLAINPEADTILLTSVTRHYRELVYIKNLP